MASNNKYRRLQLETVYGPFCFRCSTSKNLTVDHIIPKSQGGTNAWANMQLLCRDCHKVKDESVGTNKDYNEAKITLPLISGPAGMEFGNRIKTNNWGYAL